ncbi:hypothetical protein [Clostridium psychrophilum]|uniref:hypothetical protein n=1 Tax=Clostridium psychrophilum TaxID=132926 RepID=UPI001C0DCC64|nr:hypothetical protein [Clostridium psychrophilum]MBU3182797.1 hypothetical protein [Clostridium psychrophilum]
MSNPNNNQNGTFYLNQQCHNNHSTQNDGYEKYECNNSTHSFWRCSDEDYPCYQPKCKNGLPGPAGPVGPVGPGGPQGPIGPGFNSYLNGVITTNRVGIAVGEVIPYDTVGIVGPDYSYNALTGILTVNTTGVYVFDWRLCVTPDPGTVSIQIDMVKFPDLTFVGGISITATNPLLNGSDIVYAATAGDTFGFVNNSNGAISLVLVGLLGPIGTISIHRIY